ncbi:hypothetical protein QTP88_010897 [Uroleucon formosanum]
MSQICETVSSNRGGIKFVIDGYIMTKDKNRDDLYYWCCEKRKTLHCGGYACTILNNGQHNLRNTKEHNHSPDFTRKDIMTAVHNLKRKAHETNDTPAQIIKIETNVVSSLSQAYLTVRRKDIPIQRTSIDNIDVPLPLKTINEQIFLAKDTSLDNKRKLLFTTKSNVEHLKKVHIGSWTVLKTVPTLFRQLYTIHDIIVGTGESAKILSLVYALMTSKIEECYTRLFESLNDFAAENELYLNPRFILTDFDQVAINDVMGVWLQIQANFLSERDGEDEEFSLKLCQIIALAFLPPTQIPGAFDELKSTIPKKVFEIMQWFENNYTHGRIRSRDLFFIPGQSGNDAHNACDRLGVVKSRAFFIGKNLAVAINEVNSYPTRII